MKLKINRPHEMGMQAAYKPGDVVEVTDNGKEYRPTGKRSYLGIRKEWVRNDGPASLVEEQDSGILNHPWFPSGGAVPLVKPVTPYTLHFVGGPWDGRIIDDCLMLHGDTLTVPYADPQTCLIGKASYRIDLVTPLAGEGLAVVLP